MERHLEVEGNRHVQMLQGERRVLTGIAGHVKSQPQTVQGSTSAVSVKEDTSEPNAPWQRFLNENIARGQHFKRRMVWGDRGQSVSGMALWTETAEPLPRPPASEYTNVATVDTINK